MRGVAALLAAAILAAGAAGCGEDSGAEPGAPDGASSGASSSASLILDFTPNAVHSGIYAARSEGFYARERVALTVRQPGESSDAPKLLAAGKVDFAILDIHDLGIARERGFPLVGVMPIVDAPLAAVLAPESGPVKQPRDLDGNTVGVTGLPSDEAVVDSEVSADGGDPAGVERVTIGFNAVASLAAGKVDAATGFWNAEGIALRRRGVPTRVFKVDEYGAPRYPELVLATTDRTIAEDPALVDAVVAATRRGYGLAVEEPKRALADLLSEAPGLDRAEQAAELHALLPDLRPAGFDRRVLRAWARWDLAHGLLERPLEVDEAFRFGDGELLGGAEQPGD
jgi:NitT/TauT family transport system substrate-binding protein/putative hydroxymethylpyrimidine transport system substrate-binding protein